MHNPIQQLLQDSAILRSGLSGLTALCLLLCAQLASDASMASSATNVDGEPLSKVSICLTQAGNNASSAKLQLVLLQTNEVLGDPEAFYDFSAGFEDLALVNK